MALWMASNHQLLGSRRTQHVPIYAWLSPHSPDCLASKAAAPSPSTHAGDAMAVHGGSWQGRPLFLIAANLQNCQSSSESV